MKTWKHNLPIFLLAVFELIIGVLLFLKPEEFTGTVIVVFGVVLLVFGTVYLIQFFVERRQSGLTNWGSAVLAVFSLALGFICICASGLLLRLFSVIAVIYGIFLILAGILKGRTYFALRSAGFYASMLLIFFAILSIGIGGLLVLHPFESTMVMWRVAGFAWILEGAGDIISLLLAMRK